MATTLTAAAQLKADLKTQTPQLVFVIDGVDTVYGIGQVKKYAKIGDTDLMIGDDWKIGGLNAYEDQLDVISLEGSSNTISQQLLQDKGGTSSISSVAISLIDKNSQITDLITPGVVVDDVLGRKAEVYLGYRETAFPQDFVRIFSGIIDEVQAGTTIILNVAHPEQKKRGECFQQVTTELTQPLNYRSVTAQGIKYQTRRDVVGTVTLTYTAGATAGSEVVTVVGNAITVQIANGVSTNSQIRDAVEKKIEAVAKVELKVEDASAVVSTGAYTLSSDTTIYVTTTEGFLLPAPAEGFRTYVRINDEVIEYTGLTATTFTGITRGALSALDERAEGAAHDEEDSVESFYRLEGSAVELALKVMMSGGDEYYATGVKIKSIGEVEGVGVVPNSLWFDNLNVQDKYGITPGAFITIIDDEIPGNNITDEVIEDIVVTEYGSYITIAGVTLTLNSTSSASCSFGSQYNVLPDGLSMGGDEVDVPEFERINEIFASSMFDYDFFLKETKNGKDFVDTEILFPTGCYTLPRRGKSSLGFTSPPLGSIDLKLLDASNTARPDQNKLTRSINRYFYNNVVFKYNEAVVDDKYLSGDLQLDADSKTRIKVNNKTLLIEAKGLRPSSNTTTIIEILKKRFLDRYRFGAEKITVSAFYGKTFNTDVGDSILFGDNALQLPDTRKGSRNFTPRLFEVVNKSLNIKTGEVKLDLLDTAYSLQDGRYGIISPASKVGIGSTTSTIKVVDSYSTQSPRKEKAKWASFVGSKILVHSEDFTVSGETYFQGFSGGDEYLMQVEPALGFVPAEGYIVDIAPYSLTDEEPDTEALSKRVFVFTNHSVAVASGTSGTQFSVGAGDASKFKPEALILVRNEDWTVVSEEVKILNVIGTSIIVEDDLGFTPTSAHFVELIGFVDGGAPYRYL